MGELFGDLLVRLGLWHPGTEVANVEIASAGEKIVSGPEESAVGREK